MEEILGNPKLQFNKRLKCVRLAGGLIWSFGICALVERSFNGLCIFRFVLGPLFLDIEIKEE